MLSKYLVRSTTILLLASFSIFPWGKVGHQTICTIAQLNLDSASIVKLKPLMAGMTLAEISTWADEIKPKRRSTAPWHYTNLPLRDNVTVKNIPKYTATQGHHPDDNLISQIKKDISVLKDEKESLKDRQQALWFLIHFVGDLHMPLHVGDDHDRGGNGKRVRYFSPVSRSNRGHVTNLHSLWDNLIEIKAAENPDSLGKMLNAGITSDERKKWSSGSVEEWAFETYEVAKNVIYADLPQDSIIILPRSYQDQMKPVVDKELQKAGIRLAYVLSNILK